MARNFIIFVCVFALVMIINGTMQVLLSGNPFFYMRYDIFLIRFFVAIIITITVSNKLKELKR